MAFLCCHSSTPISTKAINKTVSVHQSYLHSQIDRSLFDIAAVLYASATMVNDSKEVWSASRIRYCSKNKLLGAKT